MHTRRMKGWRNTVTAVVAGALGATGLAVLAPQVARADITLPADPAWVTNVSQGANRDDGFKVKALAKLGNTVFVGGSFTQIAPNNEAFTPSGGQGGTPNSSGIDQPYLFAMDATTGGVLGAFQPKLNGSVEALEAGPPGSNTVYAGGTFTSVNGSLQNGLAVLDATTGALRTDVNQQSLLNGASPGSVWGLRLVGSKLYVGGNFTTVDSCGGFDCNRGQLARFDIGTMNVDSWKIYVAAGKVQAIAVDPVRPNVVYVGGQFTAAGSRPCGGACDPAYGYLAAFDANSGALFTNWKPTPSNPDPKRGPEIRDMEAAGGTVFAAVGGGGGRLYVVNGDTSKTQIYKTFNTDGDVQALALTADRTRLFVGGHFTRIFSPASPDNFRCQMFAIGTTGSYSIQAQPNVSNGGHFGPFAVIADSALDTWWGGQLTTFAPGWLAPYDPLDPLTVPGPATCGTGDQKNKAGDPLSGGGVTHIRDHPHFADGTPPPAPTGILPSQGVFNGMNLSWTGVNDPTVTAYYVRATGPGLSITDQVVATQFANTWSVAVSPAKLQPSSVYQFKVCAVDLGDNERCSGAVAAATAPGAPKLPGSPKGFGQFTPLTAPVRIFDTRVGIGRPGTSPIPANVPIPVQITGSAAGALTTAGSVVMNVTVVSPSSAGFMTVYPTGANVPNASNLNFAAGQVVPNLVTTKIGAGGAVNLLLSAGSAHVIVDVVGTYGNASAPAGAKITTITPVRKLDSRTGLGMPGGARRIGPGETIDVSVASGSTNGVVINVTGVNPNGATFVTVFPGDVASPPNASNLNLVPGQVRPNLAMVRVPTSGAGAGKIRLYNAVGTVDLLVDVVANYTPGSTSNSPSGRVLPLDAPMRVVDTRLIGGPLLGPNSRVHDFSAIDDAVSQDVAGLVLNATAVGPTAPTFLTLFPGGEALPNASNLNVVAGAPVPNLAVSRLNAQDDLSIWNQAGAVNYIFDVTALVLA